MSRFPRGSFAGRGKTERRQHAINGDINESQVRLINQDGENIGVVSLAQARALADQAELDLVQIGTSDNVAIAKIMDYGKFLYEKKKQENEAKKNQKVIQIKEVKFRPNIGQQDYDIKMRRAVQFLQAGKRVKCTLEFRGREMATMTDVGRTMFDRITTGLTELIGQSLIEEKEQRGRKLWSKVFYTKS